MSHHRPPASPAGSGILCKPAGPDSGWKGGHTWKATVDGRGWICTRCKARIEKMTRTTKEGPTE